MQTLSIIIPVYNEKKTINELLKRVQQVSIPLNKEIIIIDDCSTDGTTELLKQINQENVTVLFQEKNGGKGKAVKRGFQKSTGDFTIIQDADLEYDPEDYKELLVPVLNGKANVVFGSRFIGDKPHRVLYFWHSVGNKILTLISNIFTNLNLTDMETCYKLLDRKALDLIKDKLSADRFGIEPEITAILSKSKLSIYEVGISYSGRTYAEGKKIGWKDGISAIYHIIKCNLRK
jgi:glycosyltransferase involved in cell wall biosynthesis